MYTEEGLTGFFIFILFFMFFIFIFFHAFYFIKNKIKPVIQEHMYAYTTHSV